MIAYFIDKIPYLFKIDKQERFIPTVYFLWKFPNILPKFYTHKEVFNKYLLNGADLMLPGLIIPNNNNETINLYTFKHINKNELYSLCLNGNDAPIAIGLTCLSGEDMYMSGMRGKCLNILHLYQDNLWSMGDRSLTVPNIPTIVTAAAAATTTQSEITTTTTELAAISQLIEPIEKLELLENNNNNDEQTKQIDHEQILTDCFIAAVKFKSKDFKLPIIVSTFMKTMQSCW